MIISNEDRLVVYWLIYSRLLFSNVFTTVAV